MAKRNWNPQSNVNLNHLSHMLRGGKPEYFAVLAEGFKSASTGDTPGAIDTMRDFLRKDIDEFISGAANTVAIREAAKKEATKETRINMIKQAIENGAKPAQLVKLGVATEDEIKEVVG